MTDNSPIIRTFDEVSATYDQLGVDFFTPMGAALVRAVAPRPGERVLDVGCGRGAVLFPAAAAVGPSGQVTGLDLAPGMVTRTAAAAAEHPQVTVRIGDAQQPDVPAASVDVLTAGLVLFFLPDPAAALTAYRTILRPGGRLGVTAFAAFDPQYQQIMKIVARYAVDPRRPPALAPMFATGDSLAAAATEAGYTTPAVTEFAVQSRLRDTDQLLAWIGSHNGQATLGKVPEARRPKLRDALAAEFTGPLTLTTRIRVLVAVRPA